MKCVLQARRKVLVPVVVALPARSGSVNEQSRLISGVERAVEAELRQSGAAGEAGDISAA